MMESGAKGKVAQGGGQQGGGPDRRAPIDGRPRDHLAERAGDQRLVHASRPTARGMPRRSVSRWYLDPGLPRSTGLGPVRAPVLGAHAQRVQARPRPVELAGAAELVQRQVVKLLPHASALPVAQPPPAGHPRAIPQLLRQPVPADAGPEHEQDPVAAGPVIQRLAAGPAPADVAAGAAAA
jgi:hypothetical protein